MPLPHGSVKSDVSVFASYAHKDDDATYGRISAITRDVARTYESLTGKSVGIFKDNESIRLGQAWRERISSGLADSSILLAFVSAAYLNSEGCRQEFREFYDFLVVDKDGRLIISLLLFDRSELNATFPNDSILTDIDALQNLTITHLRTETPGSGEWIHTIDGIARRIKDVLDEPSARSKVDATETSDKPDDDPDEPDSGTLLRLARFEDAMPGLAEEFAEFSNLLGNLDTATRTATAKISTANTFQQRLAITNHLAAELTPIADKFVSVASRIHEKMDATNMGVHEIFRSIQSGHTVLDDPGVHSFVQSAKTAAEEGIASLASIDGLRTSIDSSKGLSGRLDRPLKKIQGALLQFAEIRGALTSWLEAIATLPGQ